AIQGEGFFVLEGNLAGAADSRFYTRAGQFHIDNQGQIVNTEGMRLQGYAADAQGVLGTTVQDLVISQGTGPASATTTLAAGVNLDANEVVPTLPFDVTNASDTSNFSNNITVYDSLGNAHELTMFYAKTGVNTWDWHALIDGGELTGGAPGVPTEGAS